jgi:hypothetical protein
MNKMNMGRSSSLPGKVMGRSIIKINIFSHHEKYAQQPDRE